MSKNLCETEKQYKCSEGGGMGLILTKLVQNKTIVNFRCFETNFIKIG